MSHARLWARGIRHVSPRAQGEHVTIGGEGDFDLKILVERAITIHLYTAFTVKTYVKINIKVHL